MSTDRQASAASGVSRRDLLRRLGYFGAAALASPAALAACGSDSKKPANTTAATGAGTATTAATTVTGSTAASTPTGTGTATTAASTGTGGTATGVGAELISALGIPATDKLGGGTTWTMGSVLALTGNGSFYGKTMSRGIDLAVKHIKAAGGPEIKVVYKDHKSGDPQAGVQAMTELGTSNIPAKLASYGDDILSMLPLTQQYKCLTLDGGGGNGGSGQRQDFFWGCRALPGLDMLGGLFRYIGETAPDAKTMGFVGWDLGAKLNAEGKVLILDSLKGTSLTHNGLYELAPPNTTDFVSLLAKVKASEPDVLLVEVYGQDPGFFLDQAQAANLKAKVFGVEFTPDGLNASKGTMDKVGWTFSADYFNADAATSKLGKMFVREFKAEYGDTPDFYAANYYEDTLAMWDIIRRVLAKGGNINSGVELQNGLKENFTFASVYGGDDTSAGSFEFDPDTHSLKRREMGVFEYKAGKVTTLATFNIGAADYKKV
jgi:branched-chain amino acid transport system substrate-binding protein